MVSHLWGEDAYLKHVSGLMKTVATESVQSVEKLLLPAEHLAKTSRALMESEIIPSQANAQLERYFFENISQYSNFSGMYFGWVNGDFLHVSHETKAHAHSPFFSKYITGVDDKKKSTFIERSASFQMVCTWEESDTYDPRDRPWFKVVKSGELQWTNPYLYFTSKTPGISVSIPVLADSGEPIGALGIDIEIGTLSHYLSKNQLSANSSAFIINKDLSVVAHTDVDSSVLTAPDGKPSFSLIKVSELQSQLTAQALIALSVSGQDFLSSGIREVVFDFEGAPYHAVFHSYRKQGLDWTIVVIAPESDFIGHIRTAQYWKIAVAVVVSLLITLCALFLALRFLRPVSELQESVLRDSLTGLYNRRALDSLGDGMVKKCHNQGLSVSIVMIDIDHFKKINDRYGHPAGDEVLVSVSQRMSCVLQETDMLVRYGGEEFSLLLFDADLAVAVSVCERLRAAISGDEVLTDAGSIPVTISIGVVQIPMGDDHLVQSLYLADQALYVAKRQGRNCVSTQHDVQAS